MQDAGASLIIVLPPEQAGLDSVRNQVETLGWSCEQSLGSEQAILSLTGSDAVAETEALLAERGDCDLMEILSADQYARARWRRRLLAGLARGLGLLTAAVIGIPLFGFLVPPRTGPVGSGPVRVASIDQLADGAARLVRFENKPILLIRYGGNTFAASALCTYMDMCQLEWDTERLQLVCPCHGDAFDVFGNVIQGPASIPLPTFVVERVADELFVQRS